MTELLPAYMKDVFGYPVAMALATALGLGFGFALERAGFGRSQILAAQFYGHNMRVLKVMFTAIVTATVGLGVLGGLGVVDLGAISVPATFWRPQIIGGLLLGAGFILSGYCPGTAVVATGSGNVDGLVAIAGVMAGSIAFGVAYPWVEGLYLSDAVGVQTLPALFGVSWGVVAAGVAVMALGAFAFAEWLEPKLSARYGLVPPVSSPAIRKGAFGTLVASSAVALVIGFGPQPTPAIASAEPEIESIGAVELAKQLLDAGRPTYLVDLRAPERCRAEAIPGAACLPDDDPEAEMLASLSDARRLVVYDQDGSAEMPAALARYAGRAARLEGGYDAFARDILEAPKPPADAYGASLADYRLRRALHGHFTGQEAAAPAPVVVPKTSVRRVVKKGGGC